MMSKRGVAHGRSDGRTQALPLIHAISGSFHDIWPSSPVSLGIVLSAVISVIYTSLTEARWRHPRALEIVPRLTSLRAGSLPKPPSPSAWKRLLA